MFNNSSERKERSLPSHCHSGVFHRVARPPSLMFRHKQLFAYLIACKFSFKHFWRAFNEQAELADAFEMKREKIPRYVPAGEVELYTCIRDACAFPSRLGWETYEARLKLELAIKVIRNKTKLFDHVVGFVLWWHVL